MRAAPIQGSSIVVRSQIVSDFVCWKRKKCTVEISGDRQQIVDTTYQKRVDPLHNCNEKLRTSDQIWDLQSPLHKIPDLQLSYVPDLLRKAFVCYEHRPSDRPQQHGNAMPRWAKSCWWVLRSLRAGKRVRSVRRHQFLTAQRHHWSSLLPVQ